MALRSLARRETGSGRSSPPMRLPWSPCSSVSSAAAGGVAGRPGGPPAGPVRRWHAGLPARTRHIREDSHWRVPPPAPGLVDRRVEITGPTERKMTINALNSGAQGLAGRLRGRQHPALGKHDHRPAQPATRWTAPSTSPAPRARTTGCGPMTSWPRSWSGRGAGTWTRSTCSSTASGCRAACSTSRCTSSTARSGSWTRARGPTSTCRRWRATWRRGCGTTSSSSPRTRSASRAAPSGRPC